MWLFKYRDTYFWKLLCEHLLIFLFLVCLFFHPGELCSCQGIVFLDVILSWLVLIVWGCFCGFLLFVWFLSMRRNTSYQYQFQYVKYFGGSCVWSFCSDCLTPFLWNVSVSGAGSHLSSLGTGGQNPVLKKITLKTGFKALGFWILSLFPPLHPS